jgi:predicted MFS family arabinose efflux permease
VSQATTPATDEGHRRGVGYLELLRTNRAFRWLFAARSVSLLGDWFNTLALFALLDEMRGESASSFGWVLILKLAPLLVMGPAAGVVADRFSRKRVMVWTDLLRAVVVIGLLLLVRWPRLDLLLTLTFLQISLSAFFEPARSAAVAQICSRDELLAANALMAVTWSIMLTVGAAVGGVASHLFGWQIAILLDAATYIASALLILPIHLPAHQPARRGVGAWHALGLGDAVDGFRFMWHNPAVATMVSAKGAWGVGGALTLMLTLFGQRVYPLLGSPVLGMTLFYSARGVGTAFGPILFRRLAGHSLDAMRGAISASFLLAAVFYFAFGLVHSLPLALLFVILAHLGGATIWVFSTVLIQRSVPHAFQGRVFAAEMALFTLTFSLSTWIFGALRDALGVDLHVLMRALAGGILLAGIVWSVAARKWPLRRDAEPASAADRPDARTPGERP